MTHQEAQQLRVGDLVLCINDHFDPETRSSPGHLTRGKTYPFLGVTYSRIRVQDDSGNPAYYYLARFTRTEPPLPVDLTEPDPWNPL